MLIAIALSTIAAAIAVFAVALWHNAPLPDDGGF